MNKYFKKKIPLCTSNRLDRVKPNYLWAASGNKYYVFMTLILKYIFLLFMDQFKGHLSETTLN